jgi:hypothetical protein
MNADDRRGWIEGLGWVTAQYCSDASWWLKKDAFILPDHDGMVVAFGDQIQETNDDGRNEQGELIIDA